jgi:hypothetical protein
VCARCHECRVVLERETGEKGETSAAVYLKQIAMNKTIPGTVSLFLSVNWHFDTNDLS